jgi:hypothetical protein
MYRPCGLMKYEKLNMYTKRINLQHTNIMTAWAVADLRSSGGGWFGGQGGGGAGGGIPTRRGSGGLALWENFLQIDVENMHFRGHV